MPLDHAPDLIKIILGGTRTPNLEIRSLTPYPLGHEDSSSTGFQSPPNTRVSPRVGKPKMVPRPGFEPGSQR